MAAGAGGCGSVSAENPDAAIDAPSGPTVQLTGTIAETGVPIAAGATVDAIEIATGTKLASATSGAAGMYSIAVPTKGAPLDLYLDVKSPGRLDTRAYLEPQINSDRQEYIIVFSPATLQQLATDAGTAQPADKGLILAQVYQAGQPVAGATATVPFGPTCYSDVNASPECTLPSTGADGIAWIFAAPPGSVVISGKLADNTALESRGVIVQANVLVQIGLEP